jgi:hypothetical protein
MLQMLRIVVMRTMVGANAERSEGKPKERRRLVMASLDLRA